MTSWADDTDRAIDALLTREIEEVFKRTTFLVTNTLVRTLRNFSTLYSFRIADKLEPYKDRILASIEDDIINHPEYLYGVINEIEELRAVGVSWLELAELLEKRKSDIIKTMLSKYKWFHKKQDILPFLKALRNIGVNWNELSIIEKSANAGLLESEKPVAVTSQERYVIDLLFPGSFYRAILSLHTWPVVSKPIQAAIERQKPKLLAYLTECIIVKANFSTFFRGIRALRNQQIAWPELDELVEASKRPFITKLLTKLKNHEDSTDLLYIESVIKDAKRVVNWPELKIINDEAGGELDRARDQQIPGYEPDPFDDDIRNG
jgi:hypothetical protein